MAKKKKTIYQLKIAHHIARHVILEEIIELKIMQIKLQEGLTWGLNFEKEMEVLVIN